MLKKARFTFLFILIGISNTCLWGAPENRPGFYWTWQNELLARLQQQERQRNRQPTIYFDQETQTDSNSTPQADSNAQENKQATVNSSQPFDDPFARPGESVKVGLAFLGTGKVVRGIPVEELPVSDAVKTTIKTVTILLLIRAMRELKF